MLIAGLLLFLLGGSEANFGLIGESLALSSARVSDIADNADEQKRIKGAIEHVLETTTKETNALAETKTALRATVLSYDASRPELIAAIDRYQDQETISQKAWLDAYFQLRETVDAEQWQLLVASPTDKD